MGYQSGLCDLVAVHSDAAGARGTIERLSRAGVDGGAIELLPGAEVVTAGRYADRQVDRGSSLALARRVLRGLLLGALPGAVFGAIVVGIASSLSPVGVLAGAGGGAMFGASVGVLASLLTVPSMAASWERTFAPLVPGGVVVGVRIADPRTDRRVRRVLAAAPVVSLDEVADLDDLPDLPPPEVAWGE